MTRVLILRALKLGDLLVAVPAIRAVRRAHPRAALLLATPAWLQDIVELIGAVDQVVPTPGIHEPLAIAPGQIDIAINMHGKGPESDLLLAALEPQQVITHGAGGPAWEPEISERHRWVRLVDAFGMPGDPDDVLLARPRAAPPRTGASVVHVGAAQGSRLWPVECFADVCAGLQDRGHHVVLTGNEEERPRAEAVARAAGLAPEAVLAGHITLGEFAAQVAAARIVISVDTGAAHLASAFRRPSVVIFGPAPVQQWGPPPGPHLVITHEELRRGDLFAADPDPALLAVTPTEVLTGVDALLE